MPLDIFGAGGVGDVLNRLRAALADRYAIEREIGSGGMATVYRADDLKHHRKVAVKVLRPELAAALGAQRFLREIEIAAQLTHPHILPLHDSGEADGFLYYVMPLVEGESLRERLAREGALPIGDAVRMLRDVVDALAYAHTHGVVHRDIKPDNVMLAGRHALVTDFGVAKAVSEAGERTQLTTVGVSLGTPTYMAPEQAVADPHIDHRADLYAIGVLAYEMLTGRPPFTGSSAQAILAAHVTGKPEPLGRHREGVPHALAVLVMRCLEKKPEDRWQSASELLGQLEALVTPAGGVTPLGTRWARPLMVRGRRVPVVGIGALVVLLIAAWVVTGLKRSTRVRWAREQAIPEIRQLADSGLWFAAYRLAAQTRDIIPKDAALARLWPRFSRFVTIHSDPSGARVYLTEYAASDTDSLYLGVTPLDSVRFPLGYVKLRLEKHGFRTLDAAGFTLWIPDSLYVLDDGKTFPPGMVRVPAARMDELNLPGLEHLAEGLELGAYFIDRYEVSNRQFKQFVDSGGSRMRRPRLSRNPSAWVSPRRASTDYSRSFAPMLPRRTKRIWPIAHVEW